MLQITTEHLAKFEEIKNEFLQKTSVPKANNWESWTDEEIWSHLIEQVIVVGGSAAANRFNANANLRNQVSFESLRKIGDEHELRKTVNHVLRAIGTRYASSDISKCKKTNAIVHNFKAITSFAGCPKNLLSRLSEFEGGNSDKRKVKYLMKILKYVQSKGARDFLMELGLVKAAVALDVRVRNVLEKVGLKMPAGFEASPKLYDEIEGDILTKICRPLNLSGVEFDRMLYQNYDEIMNMPFKN